MRKYKENLRLVVLGLAITLGITVQSAALSGAEVAPVAGSDFELAHWSVMPVTVDVLSPGLG